MEDARAPLLHPSGRAARPLRRALLLACIATAVITACLTVAALLTAGRPLLAKALLPSGVRVPSACWANATFWSYSETHMAEPELGVCMDMQMVQCIAARRAPCTTPRRLAIT